MIQTRSIFNDIVLLICSSHSRNWADAGFAFACMVWLPELELNVSVNAESRIVIADLREAAVRQQSLAGFGLSCSAQCVRGGVRLL